MISWTQVYSYDAFGRVTVEIDSSGSRSPGANNPNNSYTAYAFRPDGRIDTASVWFHAAPPTAGELPDVSWDYLYDNAGNLRGRFDQGSVSGSFNTYDSSNNRLTSGFEYDMDETGYEYTYDPTH